MMNVAFIPVRGGSKSIPLKNIKEIAGKPLIYWTVKAANDCEEIDRIYVATDSEQIRNVVENFKLEKVCVIGRSEESASDTASTESAMIEFSQKITYDNIILIQATSPLLTCDDISRGFKEFYREGTDSVLSVVRQKRFNWGINGEGYAIPQNYDFLKRPRRQEFNGYWVENGAFYITSRKSFTKSRCRISGNIRLCEMDEASYFEIDEISDWIIIEQLLKRRLENQNTRNASIPPIRMFLTDCDGCLTDGGMYYTENGDEIKKFCAQDGMGFQLLHEKGIVTGIITGEKRELNRRRAQKLNLDIYEDGVKDKLSVVNSICQKYKIDLVNVAYVGDDINDIEVIKAVGFGCSVANGTESVKKVSDYITRKTGGNGAIREVIEMLLNC